MSNLQSLQSKIDERLKREMVPAFLDKYERWHTRKGISLCDCEYCALKRQATRDIGFGRGGIRFVDPVSSEAMVEEYSTKEKNREALRVKYRQMLKASAESI